MVVPATDAPAGVFTVIARDGSSIALLKVAWIFADVGTAEALFTGAVLVTTGGTVSAVVNDHFLGSGMGAPAALLADTDAVYVMSGSNGAAGV